MIEVLKDYDKETEIYVYELALDDGQSLVINEYEAQSLLEQLKDKLGQ